VASNNADWLPTYTQPVGVPARPAGTTFVSNAVPIGVSYTNPVAVFSPTRLQLYPQPSRQVYTVYANGDSFVIPFLKTWQGYVYADKWLPNWVQPNRPQGSAPGTIFVDSTILLPADLPKWLPFASQPNRTLVNPPGTTHAIGKTPGTDSTADKWQPVFPQPSRTLQATPGTIYAAGNFGSLGAGAVNWQPIIVQPSRAILATPGTTYVSGNFASLGVGDINWQPTYVQPSRTLQATPGTIYAAGNFGSLGAGAINWQPIIVQPSRLPGPVTGTDYVGPPWRLFERETIDRWQPTYVQPGRVVGSGQTTEAHPTFFNAIPLLDKWGSTFVQPGRVLTGASGDTTIKPPIPVDPQTFWLHTPAFQPSRVLVRNRGTDFATAAWPYPGTIFADAWQPTMVQPSRVILRDLGTVVALDPGGFYQPGDPDPFRGTSAPTGPDPHRGTSTRTIVVSS
jgi:hypothetical protein